jgi:hypothetical protein
MHANLRWPKLKPSENLKVGPGAAVGHEPRGAVVHGIDVHGLNAQGPACNLSLGRPDETALRVAHEVRRYLYGDGPATFEGATCSKYAKLQPLEPASWRDKSVSHDHAHADGGYFPCDGALEALAPCRCTGCACPERRAWEPRWDGYCLSCATGYHPGTV